MAYVEGAVLHGHQVLANSIPLRVKRIEPERGSDFVVWFAIVWTLFSTYFFTAQFSFLPWGWRWSSGSPTDIGNALFFLPGIAMFGLFLLLGLGLLKGALESRYGEQEWIVSHNSLEIQVSVFGFSQIQKFQDAKLRLFRSHEGEGERPCWQLFVSKGMKARVLIFSRSPSDGEVAELQQLAVLMSERTGWPLQGR